MDIVHHWANPSKPRRCFPAADAKTKGWNLLSDRTNGRDSFGGRAIAVALVAVRNIVADVVADNDEEVRLLYTRTGLGSKVCMRYSWSLCRYCYTPRRLVVIFVAVAVT